MPVGKIKWFNGTNGYDFIETGKDLFVHFSAIQQKGCRPLREGREVQYEVGEGPKGAQAEKSISASQVPVLSKLEADWHGSCLSLLVT